MVLLFVTGASGSGNSSFAQAGLLPALEEAYAAQGRQMRWSVTRPGRHPIVALEELGLSELADERCPALLRTPERPELLLATQTPQKQVNVLVLDQFEELFTQSELAERDATCVLLSRLGPFALAHTGRREAARRLPGRVVHIASLFERCKHDRIELRAMAPDELAQAIRRPIQQQARLEGKDKRLDPALVECL